MAVPMGTTAQVQSPGGFSGNFSNCTINISLSELTHSCHLYIMSAQIFTTTFSYQLSCKTCDECNYESLSV